MLAQIATKTLNILAMIALASSTHAVAQNTETAYFKDVTATSLPSDPEAHPLDVVLIDVNGDSHLDAVLAMENAPNRLYLNDGKGVFTWKKGVFAEKNMIPNMYVRETSIKMAS